MKTIQTVQTFCLILSLSIPALSAGVNAQETSTAPTSSAQSVQSEQGNTPQADLSAFDVMDGRAVSQFIRNKTFWTNYSPYRFYFNTNGRFEHQTNGDVGDLAAGQYFGQWAVNDKGELCLSYDGNSQKNICYLVLRGDSNMRPWGKFDDPVLLAPIPKSDTEITADSFQAALAINRWGEGNLIIDDNYFKSFSQTLESLNRTQQEIATSDKATIDAMIQQAKPAPTLQQYVTDITHAVMLFPMGGGTYHAPDGTAITLSPQEVNDIKRNPKRSQLPKREYDSLWFVDGNTQCWIVPNNPQGTLCQAVYDKKTLKTPSANNGYVTHVQDGYTRVITDNLIIPLSDD